MATRVFENRREAGRALAADMRLRGLEDPIVLALPRGGVPVAFEVALALGAPLDVIVVRKLGAPYQPELALGAIASGGIRALNEDVIEYSKQITDVDVETIVAREQEELERREALYRGTRPFPDLTSRDVVLVDDGLATGATMRAAVQAVKSSHPASLTVAIPTGAPATVVRLQPKVDRLVCLQSPPDFESVGEYYLDFGQTTDDEVRELLARAERREQTGDADASVSDL